MLKIVRKDSVSARVVTTPTNEWLMLRTSSKARWSHMRLPLTIGYHRDNDVFVNAPTMREVSRILCANGGELVAINAGDHTPADIAELKVFGIEIVGPFSQNPAELSKLSIAFKSLLLKEASAYSNRYPEALRKILPRPQMKRLGSIALAAILALFAMNADFSSNEMQDFSHQPLSATMGNIKELGVKSESSSSPYAKGVTVNFAGKSESTSKRFVLTLGVSGMDVANELTIQLNGKVVGEISAQLSCVDAACVREFAIDPALLQPNGNVLFIRHNAPESSYRINNVFFRAMEPATPEDQELVTQLLASAERFFEERHLLTQNIHNASEAMAEIDRLLATRTGLEAIVPRVTITRKKVTQAFKETSDDLLFKLQKELKLGHGKPAIALINDLLKLYPDPTSRQYVMLAQQRKKLQEAEK